MSEPDFKAQMDELTGEDKNWWLSKQSDGFRKQGATWGRMTHHPTIPNLVLIEAWKTRPKEEPEPVFDLTKYSTEENKP